MLPMPFACSAKSPATDFQPPNNPSMNHFRDVCLVALTVLFSGSSVLSRELPFAKPEEVGMSAAKLAEVDKVMRGYVTEKKLAGAIVAVARHGKVVHFGTYGKMDLERDKKMTKDAIFRIYSMSKAITTTAKLLGLLMAQQ